MSNYKVFFEHLPSTIVCVFILCYFIGLNFFFIYLCIFFGWLIDIDHMFDYLLFKKSIKFNLKEFISGKYFNISRKIYIPLHSYELSIILFFLYFIINEVGVIFVCLSHVLHLVQDQISNKTKPLSYFFIYRALHSFKINYVCK